MTSSPGQTRRCSVVRGKSDGCKPSSDRLFVATSIERLVSGPLIPNQQLNRPYTVFERMLSIAGIRCQPLKRFDEDVG